MRVCVNTDFSSATKLLTFSWQQPSFARLRAPVSTGSYLISSSSTGTTFCWVNKMSHLNSLQASSDLETWAKLQWNRLTPNQQWLKKRVTAAINLYPHWFFFFILAGFSEFRPAAASSAVIKLVTFSLNTYPCKLCVYILKNLAVFFQANH